MSSVVSNVTKDDMLDQMVPRRQRLKTIDKLKEFKAKDKKTKIVHSASYGFKKKLIMFVSPELSEQEIIERFKVRLAEKNINMYQKSKV